MKVILTPGEAHNVFVALVSMAKSSQVDADSMKVLLVLSDKFVEKTKEKTTEKEKEKS